MATRRDLSNASRIIRLIGLGALPCAAVLCACAATVGDSAAPGVAFPGVVAIRERAGATRFSDAQVTLYKLPPNQPCQAPGQNVSGSDGNIYFVMYDDEGACPRTIGKVTMQGVISFITTGTGGSPQIIAPGEPDTGTTPYGNDDIVYANGECEFARMNIITNKFLRANGGWRYCPSGGWFITALAWAPNGEIWFSDQYYREIAYFTPATNMLYEFPLFPGEWVDSIAVGPDRDVWFTEHTAGVRAIWKISGDGTITEYPSPPDFDASVLVGSRENSELYIAGVNDLSNRVEIVEVTRDGSVHEYTDSSESSTYVGGITVDHRNNIWVLIPGQGGISGLVRFDVHTHGFLAPAPAPAVWIATGGDGNIWFSDLKDNAIGVYKNPFP
jgi:hypothetical protein